MVADQLTVDTLRRVALVAARVSAGRRLEETLQAVADGVVETLGFGCVAVNYVVPGGDLEAVVVAGPESARELILHTVTPRRVMDRILEASEDWGPVRFVPHSVWEALDDEQPVTWIPDGDPGVDPDRWHPEDALLVPLRSAEGDLVALLSLDLPPEGRRPGAHLCELIGLFAVAAGVAIANARLTEELLAEREHLRRERSRLARSEAAFRVMFSASRGGMVTLRLEPGHLGEFRTVNQAFCRLVERDPEELLGRRWQELIAPGERAQVERRLGGFVSGHADDDVVERRLERADGSLVWVSALQTMIAGGDDDPPFLLLQVDDITERKAREKVLVEQANRDPLTGLANRRWLLGHLSEVLSGAERSGQPGALIYCDLDRFKAINDRHGHQVGDLALREVADRLRDEVRTRDVVARLGGDEFVVVAEDLDGDAVDKLVERIRWALSEPLHAVPATVDVSVGWAPIKGHVRPDELLHDADMAMYADKARG